MTDNINKIRKLIDKIDLDILRLLTTRGMLAQEIVEAKSNSSNKKIFRPEREAQILRKIINSNKGPLKDDHLYTIYREIISACLSLETDIKVTCLGPEGSFSNTALNKFFGSSVTTVFNNSISDVFSEVQTKKVSYGVVPIENSYQGSINLTLEHLMNKQTIICGEINLPINHCLLSKSKKLKDIKKVYSHEQSFLQCREWLLKNLPDAEKINTSSNSAAVKKISNLKNCAAIAGKDCSVQYKIPLLKKNIHDMTGNMTRFIVIGNEPIRSSGLDKTSILISIDNKSGALNSLLQPLAKNKISMSKIESIPTKINNWEYMFLLDIDGHIDDANINSCLKIIKKKCLFFKHLGSYPKSI